MINEVLEGTFNFGHEIKTLPKSEAMISIPGGSKKRPIGSPQLENALNVIGISISVGWQMHHLSQGRHETQLLLFQ